MPGRMILLAVTSLLLVTGSVFAQDLNQYDPAGYSGGYAEGVSGPLGSDQLYPYDAQETWQHGYIQYMPFYGAYKHFRPYNYKNVLSQTQTAAGWGMSAKMPYSQQYWHRYHARSRMSENGLPGEYRSLSAYRKPAQKESGSAHQGHHVPSQKLVPQGQVPVPPQKIQVPPAPRSGGALQFTPAPTQKNKQPHTGISFQYRAQQPSAIQSPNGTFVVPQSNTPVNKPYSQQPLLIAP